MAYYKICPCCGAALDPGERCDCEKEAAPDAANIRSGLMENGLPTNFSSSIVSNNNGVCQA